MSAETDVYDALSTSPEVTALVGTSISPDVGRQGVLPPLIVFERTASEPVTTIHDGAPVAVKVTVSISSWAFTREDCEEIGDACVLALHELANCTNRFGHFDEATGAYAAVIDCEIWET